MRTPRWFAGSTALAIVLAVGVGCSESTDPDDGNGDVDERPAGELNIVRLDPTAPPLESSSITFWAKRGESADARLYFQLPGGGRGEEFLRFELDDESLLARPDGTPFAEGDSVEITITAVDPAQILFEFQPSGLQFSPSAPAELEIRYAAADDDLNEDGVIDNDDRTVETELGLWRQETPSDPFVRIGSAILDEDLDEVEAELTGFTRYALAY